MKSEEERHSPSTAERLEFGKQFEIGRWDILISLATIIVPLLACAGAIWLVVYKLK